MSDEEQKQTAHWAQLSECSEDYLYDSTKVKLALHRIRKEEEREEEREEEEFRRNRELL